MQAASEELVTRSKERGRGAPPCEVDVDRVWNEFHSRLLGFVRARVANHTDAEDVLQDVFTRLVASVREDKSPENVSGWLYRVTRNTIADYHRVRASAERRDTALRQEETVHDAQSDASGWLASQSGEVTDSDDAELSAQLLSLCLRPMLSSLKEDYAQALSLTDLGELSQAEAARQLGLSSSGMKSRVQRARGQLKVLVQRCCEVELDTRQAVVGFTPRALSLAPTEDQGDCSAC